MLLVERKRLSQMISLNSTVKGTQLYYIMKENKKLENGLAWIEEHIQSFPPPREELHTLIKEASEQFKVDVDLMRRKAESTITHTIDLSNFIDI